MKFKSAIIKNFRRFTDLTVLGIPQKARLIMLAGPNGCGKSCFFDALHTWYNWTTAKNRLWEMDYHGKAGSPHRDRWGNDVKLEFHEPLPQEKKKILYVRSAYRNDPEFQIQHLNRAGDPLSEHHVSRMIDNDAAVARNFRRLASQVFDDIFEPEDGSVTLDQFTEQLIGDIRTAFSKLFPNVELNSLGNPLEDGTFRFTKGTSRGFQFKNLSGGEKAAFDLILDLVVSKRAYDNTIFCIDEPESHMHARLQADLLSVLYDLIPENCQLLLATHSIGMMRRARDIEAKNPGSVVFLDFGNYDFDQPQTIEPVKNPNRVFWERAYKVALGDLAALVAPSQVVICEGEPLASRPVGNHSHDAKCYERIFEDEFPETKFVSMGSDRQIIGDKRGLAEALRVLIGGLKVVRLIDRDNRTDGKISELRKEGVRVLSRRNLESYLFDGEVIQALATSVGKADKTEELLAEKNRIHAAKIGIGSSQDNLKPGSHDIYIACKKILGLNQYGNDAKEFARETLAPLIKPGMAVYEELKSDVFGATTGS